MSKKKRKKSLSGIPVPAVVKTAGNSAWKYLFTALGLGLGILALKKVPKTNIALLNGLVDKILPGGVVVMIAWWMSNQSNPYAKFGAWGVGTAGAIDIVRKLVGDKFPQLTDLLPSLGRLGGSFSMQGMRGLGESFSMQGMRGLRGMRGLGDPGYAPINVGDFQYSYYKKNAFQGMGNTSAYALGNSSPYALGNTSPNALNKPKSYAMN
jgi:hypothetical protein